MFGGLYFPPGEVCTRSCKQLSIPLGICAPGTHYCWVARGNVDSKAWPNAFIYGRCRESNPRPLTHRSDAKSSATCSTECWTSMNPTHNNGKVSIVKSEDQRMRGLWFIPQLVMSGGLMKVSPSTIVSCHPVDYDRVWMYVYVLNCKLHLLLCCRCLDCQHEHIRRDGLQMDRNWKHSDCKFFWTRIVYTSSVAKTMNNVFLLIPAAINKVEGMRI